jgi:uncharacterized coiled-coil protein SlyX
MSNNPNPNRNSDITVDKMIDLMAIIIKKMQEVMCHLTKMSNKMYLLNRNTINSNNIKNATLKDISSLLLETKLVASQTAVKVDSMYQNRKKMIIEIENLRNDIKNCRRRTSLKESKLAEAYRTYKAEGKK